MNRSLIALPGAAFAILLGAAFVVTRPPDSKEPAARITAFYADSGNRAHLIVGMALVCLAAVSWVVFTAGVRTLLSSSFARSVVPAAAATTAAVLGLLATVIGSIAIEVASEKAPVPTADFVRYQLVATFFFPMFLLFLWVLVVSVVLAVRRSPAPSAVLARA